MDLVAGVGAINLLFRSGSPTGSGRRRRTTTRIEIVLAASLRPFHPGSKMSHCKSYLPFPPSPTHRGVKSQETAASAWLLSAHTRSKSNNSRAIVVRLVACFR